MASLMLQYARPTEHTRNWTNYNGRVRELDHAPAANAGSQRGAGIGWLVLRS